MIKMTKTAAGPQGTWTQGQEYTLDAAVEDALVACGSAVFVRRQAHDLPPDEKTVERVEVAVQTEPENAAKRTTRKRR